MTTISRTRDNTASQRQRLPAKPCSRTEPDRNCPLCPRLVSFRERTRAREPDWFNAPVPSFGDPDGRLLIVGLAPGMQGANRTGRPFTGDYAGDLLYATLLEYGFAKGVYQARPDDGLTLVDCRIGNAVHCVPPQNKPLPAEINTCRHYLANKVETMPNLRAIMVFGSHRPRLDPEGIGLARGGSALFTWRGASRRELKTLRQLSLLALQHQHAGADAGDVPQRVCEHTGRIGLDP